MSTYEEAKASCHVRSAIVRLSAPTVRYWKNHPVPFDERVPAEDQQADDWAEHDPREGMGPYKLLTTEPRS